MKGQWVVDERPLRDDVRAVLPEDWQLRVFKVLSGDSGKTYWVQVLRQKAWHWSGAIFLCDCNVGKFYAPAWLLSLPVDTPRGPVRRCKHGEHVLAEGLKEAGL